MAETYANTIGTDEDRMNCPFYFKNGACRYGNQCTRRHIRPTQSRTLLVAHMYQNPPHAIALSEGHHISDDDIMKVVEHFEKFYMEVFLEVATFGEIEEMEVVDNIGEHMIGNVYIRFATEEDAENVIRNLSGRYYSGKLVMPELSAVTNFKEGSCRQFDTGTCRRGGSCNFMHLKRVSKDLLKALYKQMYKENPQYKERHRKNKKQDDISEENEGKVKRHQSDSESKRKSRRSERDRSKLDDEKEAIRPRDKGEDADNEDRRKNRKDQKRHRKNSEDISDTEDKRRKKDRKHRRKRSDSQSDTDKVDKGKSKKHKKERKRSSSKDNDKRTDERYTERHRDRESDRDNRKRDKDRYKNRTNDERKESRRDERRSSRHGTTNQDTNGHRRPGAEDQENRHRRDHTERTYDKEVKDNGDRVGNHNAYKDNGHQQILENSRPTFSYNDKESEARGHTNGGIEDVIRNRLQNEGALDLNSLKRDLLGNKQ